MGQTVAVRVGQAVRIRVSCELSDGSGCGCQMGQAVAVSFQRGSGCSCQLSEWVRL